jgi:hypothetical protein
MPQAAGIMQIIQMVMPLIEKLMDLFKNGMQNNQSDQEMADAAKKQMADEGVTDPNQQSDLLTQTALQAKNMGFLELANKIEGIRDLISGSGNFTPETGNR